MRVLFFCIILCIYLLQWGTHATPFYRPLFSRLSNQPKLASIRQTQLEKGENTSTNIEDQHFLDKIEEDNESAVYLLQTLLHSTDWETVGETDGVQVHRRTLHAAPFVAADDAEHGMKHICIKSSAVLQASAEDVFNLFVDNSRVREYNEHCQHIQDVLHVPPSAKNSRWTKISWACSPKYGIFKARHFFSVVHYRKSPQQLLILNRPAYLKAFNPPLTDSIRGTVLIAGNIIVPIDATSCRLTLIAQVNPGGSADSSAAAWLLNKLITKGPPAFIRKLERAAQSKT